MTTSPPAAQVLSIVTVLIRDGMVTFPYTQAIQATGGDPPFVWSVSAGSLPHNLALASASTYSAAIAGTPDTAQTASFTIEATDAAGQSASESYTLNINSAGSAQLQPVSGEVAAGTIEIQGLSAGGFNPAYWQQDTLNWVPDVREPMFSAQTTGTYQNIYAPWPLEQPDGWRMFYGGWDGVDVPHDEIHSATTDDFLTFGSRDLIIGNGAFLNVNNVNVQQSPDGSLHMICTGGQAGNAPNWPLYFSSPDGVTWNGTPEPYAAQFTDAINMQGYAGFGAGNFNGANVLLLDNGAWVLYFVNWNNAGNVYRATATTLPNFQFQGAALPTDHLVNDVKKFEANGTNWYLMGLHYNTQSLWYSLSNDGVTFQPEQSLFNHLSAQDLYIVALGFVTKGDQVLGALYGASGVSTLDQNQIFARWLQKRVVIADSSGTQFAQQGGYGPDRQWFPAPASGSLQGMIWVYDEDGITPLASGSINVNQGEAYQLVLGGG